MTLFLSSLFACALLACQYNANQTSITNNEDQMEEWVYKTNSGTQICTRYYCPEGYARTKEDSLSFAFYLRHLPLKPDSVLVNYYNGDTKAKSNVYDAVIDMPISPKDLQQCADAVMRLRGEYLFSVKQYNAIQFRFVGDGQYHSFVSYANGHYTYPKFRTYMDYVFNYANTASLKKQLKEKVYSELAIGDVLIQSGQPYGHAVIVVDLCANKEGQKKYMLAQSYMPAQETQLLVNPENGTVWFTLNKQNETIVTPEWVFTSKDLRTW
jgi:hypothetical protein